MLLMALSVCWTAAMTKRSPGQGGQPSSGCLGSCLALCVSEQSKSGFEGGRGTGMTRGQKCLKPRRWSVEPPDRSRRREQLSSVLLRAVPHSRAYSCTLSLDCRVHGEAVCLGADVVVGLQREQQRGELSWSPDLVEHVGASRKVAEGGVERERERCRVCSGGL